MGFITPQVLWLLLLLVPLVIGWTFIGMASERRLARFIVPQNWKLLANSASSSARFNKGILVLIALAMSIVAAARPYWGEHERELQRSGMDMLIAIDVSNSMRARDIPTTIASSRPQDIPTRLDYTRTLIRQMLLELPGQRIGVVPFAGEAFVQCPLTTDYSMVLDSVRFINHDSVGMQGTNFPDLIRVAIDAFERAGTGSRVLVIFTDGEDHSDEIAEAARKAAEANIQIFAVGIGTRDGAPILEEDGQTLKEGPDGTKVITRLNEEILRTLAVNTNGRSFFSPTGRLDISPLISDLKRIARGELVGETRVIRQERYQWPLAIALICLSLDVLLRERRGRMPKPLAGRPTA